MGTSFAIYFTGFPITIEHALCFMPYINSPVSEIPQGKSTATPNATPRDINMMKGVMGACVDRLEAQTNAQTSPNKVARGKYLLFNGRAMVVSVQQPLADCTATFTVCIV